MSEKYMFFNSTDQDEREYSAADMADFISGVCSNGVLDGLNVTLNNNDVVVSAGKAVINGYVYVLDENMSLPVDVLGVTRYDRVVIKLDSVQRQIHLDVKTGTDMTVPELTQNNEIFEISLAVLTVQANTTVVTGITTDAEYVWDYRKLKETPILYGTSEPSSRKGNDGDIYIQYEE